MTFNLDASTTTGLYQASYDKYGEVVNVDLFLNNPEKLGIILM